ncbi:hypothetical protein [Epilithonimonas arachidiradicis]|uniref:Uncharacterized protein n=1 Tax=Epilithonimonas arachidiradicis TaxID=1617282 RepID=A0A420DAA2_9FLAO|nr:hypothetical protein [Epilithonimonas arachidiradicis]RKE88210.1 hypothetical protein BXY58_1353 [Epilithonimonas arachidiradicis]GGG50508.1 hypothetical protein GCM10007332_10210 [Epilithonimonas arachidiradicis]
MAKISESLIILNFIGIKFESLFKVLTDNGLTDFHTGIQRNVYRKLYNLGIDEETLASEKYKSFIKTESSEIFPLIHENISKGIIDLYSFKQEYDGYFNSNDNDDKELNAKILKFKAENKSRLNEIDWTEIKDLRNTILSHNLRDKKRNNAIAHNNMQKFVKLSLDYKKCLLYFTQMSILHHNLKNEFSTELKNAEKELLFGELEK